MRSSFIVLPLFLWACSEKSSEQTAQSQTDNPSIEMEEEKEEYSEEEKDEYNEEEKDEYNEEEKDEYSEEEKDEYESCSSSFNPQTSCTGSWEETICLFENTIWWCQEGVWMSEDDK